MISVLAKGLALPRKSFSVFETFNLTTGLMPPLAFYFR